MEPKRYTEAEWKARGEELFGPDLKKWAFRCPVCGRTQTAEDFELAGLSGELVYLDCLARHGGGVAADGGEPCTFRPLKTPTNVLVVMKSGARAPVLDFAEPEGQAESGEAGE